MIGQERVIHFKGVAMGEACTVVLRGASTHLLEEADRSLHDALCVLQQTVKDHRVLYGGGWPEVRMAAAVDAAAQGTAGKKAVAMEAFARALRSIPAIIADNAGLDSAEAVQNLRAAHQSDPSTPLGIDVMGQGSQLEDMSRLGVYEPYKVKHAVLTSATDGAEMILRVDDIIKCAPRQRR